MICAVSQRPNFASGVPETAHTDPLGVRSVESDVVGYSIRSLDLSAHAIGHARSRGREHEGRHARTSGPYRTPREDCRPGCHLCDARSTMTRNDHGRLVARLAERRQPGRVLDVIRLAGYVEPFLELGEP
jgi:hypothetical protein